MKQVFFLPGLHKYGDWQKRAPVLLQYHGHWLSCSRRKSCSHRRLFFFQDHLLEIRAYWLPLKCSRAKLWKSKLPRILNYLIKHHNLPSHCKYQPVTLLRIKKTIIISPKSKEIAQSNISISQSFIFSRIPNFVRVHWVCLLI